MHVRMASHTLDERRRRIESARAIQWIENGNDRQAAYANVDKLSKLIDQSARSASIAKAPVLAIIRRIEDEHTKFTRDLENEANRLKKAIGEYNAAKEQAERKDNVV